MDAKVRVHGHFNGLKTTLLFALMWAIIMLIWWATGGSRQTLSIYIVIGLITTFGTYWFSDKLAIASMGAREVSEQEAPEIYQIVRELSAKAGKPMPRIYIAPTMSPNAFATGRNERHAAVCCTQGILQILNARELRGVLGHELMHAYNHDILTSAIASAMATVISKKDGLIPAKRDLFSSTKLITYCSVIISPFILIRSRKSFKCGDVYSPVLYPASCNMEASM